MTRIRRVVTGQTADGKSVFVSDEEVEPVTLALLPGSEFHRMWGSDTLPKLPTDGSEPPTPAYFPPAPGYRIGFFTVPPAGDPDQQQPPADLDIQAALAEMEEKLPGLAGHMEPDNPGMHTTDTVDFEVVISGEVVCELDDGAEVTLRPGDMFVQNGTRHRWRNPGSDPAVLFVVLIGAERKGERR
jgi:mannose-6-phosphate isomerase-like protein (cupin superfamily)